MEGGQFKGSECQVLMCLFSITAVPGNDREKTNGNTDILHTDFQLYPQSSNSTMKVSYLSSKNAYLFISNLHTLSLKTHNRLHKGGKKTKKS